MLVVRKNEMGFTLIELLISIGVFMTVAGIALSALIDTQKQYRSMEMRAAVEERMRAALELMTQEVGQAGLPGLGLDSNGLEVALTRVTVATAGPTSEITVDSTAAIVKGEILTIGNGANQEAVQVIDFTPTTITGTFTKAHPYQDGVYALGVFPEGIINSNSTQLEIFGDLKGLGRSLVLAKYACPASYPGPFTRTEYDVQTGSLISGPISLIDNVTYCQFTIPPGKSYSVSPLTSSGEIGPYDVVLITGVGISITSESETTDPVTHQPFKLTKSFLNIQPRNIIAAQHEIERYADAAEIQPYSKTDGIFASLP